MTDHVHNGDCQVKVVIIDTNAYFNQYHFVLIEGEEIMARGRAGTQRGVAKKLIRIMKKLGYDVR